MNRETMQTQDQPNLRELAVQARDLYDLTTKMQRVMLRMFFNEFCDLDEEEYRASLEEYQ